MAVTQARLDRYRAELDDLGDAAFSFVDEFLRAIVAEEPGISVAELRNAAIDAVDSSLYAFGGQASDLALDLFEEIMERGHGLRVDTAIEDVIPDDMVDGGVRYAARKLVEGDTDAFRRDVADLSRYYIKRSAMENMERNCFRNDVRYARVPSGRETCAFCFMLNSRGFVYRSEQTAGHEHAYHENCDCVIVPGFKDDARELGEQIEGYDPDGMLDRWHACEKTVGGHKQARAEWKAMDAKARSRYKGENEAERYASFRRARIMREVETRDWRWLYTGKAPHYEAEPGAKPNRKEIDVALMLAEHGYKSRFRETRSKGGKRTSDVFFVSGGYGNPALAQWEFKSPTGNGKQTISHQFEEAAGQSKNIVIDASGLGDYWTIERLEEEVCRKLNREHTIVKGQRKGEKWLYDEVIILAKDGSAIKKKRD